MSCFCCRLWLPPSCCVLEIGVPLLFWLCKACGPCLEIEPTLDLGATTGSMLTDSSLALPHPTQPVSQKAKNCTSLHAHRLNLLFGFMVSVSLVLRLTKKLRAGQGLWVQLQPVVAMVLAVEL